MTTKKKWYRVLAKDQLPEGRVETVQAGKVSLVLSHYEGKYCAMDNRCPHQGGPQSIRVTQRSQPDRAPSKLFSYDGPGMVEIMSDPELN
ncbi:MAG TPA: Rieske (2Fe-2S) protein [Caldithrix abyssi]|uniref:Rieske (2Fe-2S) protein n=1 Tax=Caldithrix abyssi TaxID=187145 RepID=A0A7V4WVI3_CALAY|nr:Rieske (2Fe-2S) protein [Caldithrix abyssi]